MSDATEILRVIEENTVSLEVIFNSTVKEMDATLATGYKLLDEAIKKYPQIPEPGAALGLENTELHSRAIQPDSSQMGLMAQI